MKTPDILKAVEERMNNALLAYSQQRRLGSARSKSLIDDLRKATIEFLELRRQLSLGRGPMSLNA